MVLVLIIGASQIKYFGDYLKLSTNYQVVVDSVSGRRVQDVSLESIANLSTFEHVIVHLGTNNIPHEGPSVTVRRMEQMITDLRHTNPKCKVYVSSVLPRATSSFAGKKFSAEKIEELNERADTLNALYKVLLTRFDLSYFIDNNVVFQNGDSVNRNLLSRDGLHLAPLGVQNLLSNMLSNLVLNLLPISLPSYCPAPSTFIPLPSADSLSTASTPLVPQSSNTLPFVTSLTSKCSMSYRDALLSPGNSSCAACSPNSLPHQVVSPFKGRKLRVTTCDSSISNRATVSPASTSLKSIFNSSHSKRYPYSWCTVRRNKNCKYPQTPSFRPSPSMFLKTPSRPAAFSSSKICTNLQHKSSNSLKSSSPCTFTFLPSPKPADLSLSDCCSSCKLKNSLLSKSSFRNISPILTSEVRIPSLESPNSVLDDEFRHCLKSELSNFSCLHSSQGFFLPDTSFIYQININNRFQSLDSKQVVFPSYRPVNGGGFRSDVHPRLCEKCGNFYKTKQSFCNHNKICSTFASSKSVHDKISYPRTCEKCGKRYSIKQSFSRHLKESCVPKITSCDEVIHCDKKRTQMYPRKCDACNHVYKTRKTFSKHKVRCQIFQQKSFNKISCSTCSLKFSSPAIYHKHHAVCSINTSPVSCTFTGCDMKFFSYRRMLRHLKSYHYSSMTHTLRFYSENDFNDWKRCEEQKNFSFLKKVCGTRLLKNNTQITYYQCMFNNDSKSKQRIKRKTARIRRLNRIPLGSCPGEMVVKVFISGLIKVKYVSHHSHPVCSKNLMYHRWLPETRAAVKKLLQDGVSVNEIRKKFISLKDIQEPYTLREQFMTNREILRYKYHLQQKLRKNHDDVKSIMKHVEAMTAAEKCKVLVFKPKGCATYIGDIDFNLLPCSSELFVYGFQTDRQLKEFKEGAKRLVCIDATFDSKRYGFFLFNILVPDEYHNGYIAAQFITNRLDSDIVTLIFRCLKMRCPDLMVKMFMTDDDPTIYEAFAKVFTFDDPNNEPKHLLCKWHVTRAWQLHTKKKIANTALAHQVYQNLLTLMEARNSYVFCEKLDNFLKKFARFTLFIDYFKTNYCLRPDKWAMCYRNFYYASIDSNMLVEAFHSTLKKRLGRKRNLPVNEFILILEEIENNRWLKLNDRRLKGEPPVDFQSIRDFRHLRGINISPNLIRKISKWKWEVKSETEKNIWYIVTLLFHTCNLPDHCFIRCMSCIGLCSHLFICSCSDEAKLCKHVHRIYSLEMQDFNHSMDSVGNSTEVNTINFEVINEKVVSTGNGAMQTDHSPQPQTNAPFPAENFETVFQKLFEKFKTDFKSKDSRHQADILESFRSLINQCEGVKCQQSNHSPSVPSMYCSFTSNQRSLLRPSIKPLMKRGVPPNLSSNKSNVKKIVKLEGQLLNVNSHSDINVGALDRVPKTSACSTNNTAHGVNVLPLSSALQTVFCSTPKSTISGPVSSTSYSCCKSKSFTKPIDNFIAASQHLYKIDDHYTNAVELKSLDMFISPEEETQLKKVSPSFIRGWLYDSVINIFIHIVLKNMVDCYQLTTMYTQMVERTENAHLCAARFPSISYNSLKSLIIPCCMNNHWVLIMVKVQEKKLLFLDPLTSGPEERHKEFLSKWMQVLSILMQEDIFQWQRPLSPPHTLQPCSDEHNCGVYVCFYAFKLLNDELPNINFDTDEFRKYIFDTVTSHITKSSC